MVRKCMGVALAWATACGGDPAAGGDPPFDPTGSTSGDHGGDGAQTDASTDDGTTGTTDDGADESTTGGPSVDPGDPWDPPPALPTLPDDVVAAIAADIDAALANPSVAGTTQGVLVIDGETGQEIYAKNPELRLKPASNTKLMTTAVAIDALGPEHELVTEVFADPAPDGNGHVAGELHVVIHHDVTWSSLFFGSNFIANRIAEELYAAGLRSVGGDLVVHGEAVYEGGSTDYYDPVAHRSAAAGVVASSLASAGIAVAGSTVTAADFDAPGDALLTWSSPPLPVEAMPTNTYSHNLYADCLVRHIGSELGAGSTYGDGTAAVIEWLADIGSDTEGLILEDGSGLSHGNRLSARTLIDTFVAMRDLPSGEPWIRSFAISGVRGTLGSRMTGSDTWGRVWGKTGTLTGVISTSGVLFNRHDGRRYFVAILFNDVGNSTAARGVQDDVFGVVARDHWGAGRPAAPTLLSVRGAPLDVIEIEWTPVEGATGYLVWLSEDGITWNREDARLVSGSSHRAGELPIGPAVFVRVTAIGDGGESDASDVYGARLPIDAPAVLVVDGIDRWQGEPIGDNPLGRAHDFAVPHAFALPDDLNWDVVANEAVIAGDALLDDYDGVVWMLGEESTVDETFDPTEQALVSDYLAADGRLFVSGAEIGWDLVEMGDPADAAFFASLGVEYVNDDAGSAMVRPIGGVLDAPTGIYRPEELIADFPDVVNPGAGSSAWLEYIGGLGGAAAVASEQVVFLGFPFETIDDADSRTQLMTAAADHLGW